MTDDITEAARRRLAQRAAEVAVKAAEKLGKQPDPRAVKVAAGESLTAGELAMNRGI